MVEKRDSMNECIQKPILWIRHHSHWSPMMSQTQRTNVIQIDRVKVFQLFSFALVSAVNAIKKDFPEFYFTEQFTMLDCKKAK